MGKVHVVHFAHVIPTQASKMASAMLKHMEVNNAGEYSNSERTVMNNDNSDKGKKHAAPPLNNDKTGALASMKPSKTNPLQPILFNKEALEILRKMNKNINKTTEKVEALSIRVDNMSLEMEQGYDSQ